MSASSLPSRDGEAGLCLAEPKRGKVWKPSQGFHDSDGEAGLCLAEPKRGKVWKPTQGFHINVKEAGGFLDFMPARGDKGMVRAAGQLRYGVVA